MQDKNHEGYNLIQTPTRTQKINLEDEW